MVEMASDVWVEVSRFRQRGGEMDGVAFVTPKLWRVSTGIEVEGSNTLSSLTDAGVAVNSKTMGLAGDDTSVVILIGWGGLSREDLAG